MPGLFVPVGAGYQGTPFAESQDAGAAAANVITLAAVPGRRYAITQIIASAAQIAVVAGIVTVTNIGNVAGTAETLGFRFVETVAAGALLNISFEPVPLFAVAENTAVVVTIPAIGAGAATSLTVVGALI